MYGLRAIAELETVTPTTLVVRSWFLFCELPFRFFYCAVCFNVAAASAAAVVFSIAHYFFLFPINISVNVFIKYQGEDKNAGQILSLNVLKIGDVSEQEV